MGRGTRTKSFSARFDEAVSDRLEQRKDRAGLSKSALAQRYIDEGMRMEDHPGIGFRSGPAGRRACLVAGPDVWEVISTLKSGDDSGEEALGATAEYLNLREGQVRAAVRYYAAFPEEIAGFIRRNEEEAERHEAAWRREQALLG